MKQLITLLIIAVSVSFSSFAQYKTQNNLSYYHTQAIGNDAYMKEQCLLDIYYPENKQDFATIIWFHGGGITGGQKEIPEALKNKGYAIIGVGYRLSPKATAPAYIEDAAAAVAWVFNNIEKFGGDKKKLFVSGHSAGGYLGMMITLDKSYLSKYAIDANVIAGVIPFSGQAITHFTIRKEQGIKELQPTIDKYAPLYHVRKDCPPMLLITGDKELELFGRYEENAYLDRMMKLAGNTTTRLYELQGFDHGGMATPAFPLLVKEVVAILKQKAE